MFIRSSEHESGGLDIHIPEDRYYVDGDEVVVPISKIRRNWLIEVLLKHALTDAPVGVAN